MKVKHCPFCGSDNIDGGSYSSEYAGSYSEWSCNKCNWRYKGAKSRTKGSTGTHPRKVDPDSEQESLTGKWCSTCNTCARLGYCLCVEEGQTGYCKVCAKYSSKDRNEMLEVATYFGKHSTFEGFPCDLCGEQKARLKTL